MDLVTLYSDSKYQWRLDYTGCGVGVDWRTPMPKEDTLGYILMRAPASQFSYGCLPEQFLTPESLPYWKVPGLDPDFRTPFGIPFMTGGTKVLALVNTEPRSELPSAALLALEEPLRLEKLYLLTANLTKTLKSYYPGAEVVIHYASGPAHIAQLIPPYTMSCATQHFSPHCSALRFGNMIGSPVIPNPDSSNLAVSDVVIDPKRLVEEIEFRCVTSETVFGLLGATLLLARQESTSPPRRSV
jgi:hypothetical protein